MTFFFSGLPSAFERYHTIFSTVSFASDPELV